MLIYGGVVGHKIKHKVKVKEEEQPVLEQPVEEIVEDYNDQFVEIANEALDKAINYKFWILGAIAITVAIVATFSVIKASKESKELKVSTAFSEATNVLEAEVIENSAADGQFKTNKDKLNAVIEKFESFKRENPNTKLAIIADLHIANSYYELGKYDEALTSYNSFITKTDDSSLKELASLRKGIILKETSKYDDAISALEKLNGSKNNYIAPASLYQIAEIYSLKKDDTKAKTFYERVKKEYSESFFSRKAATKL